jgi:hypothetical protein
MLAAFLPLVYASMCLGTSILAAGRERAWVLTQLLCVVVSGVADPFLIPWFQDTMNNGSLGACVTLVGNEVLMVAAGLLLCERGIVTGPVLRTFLATMLGVAGMFALAHVMGSITPFVVAPLAAVVYFVLVWAARGVDPEQVQAALGFVKRKLVRR